ncbi:MAG TPA: PBP1A family penicillin-binding protein [Gemmatimonadaceae bacterium]|nr:PBP1A family penicillin-binding protein [Gemmatimonadaceae bacterium]
MPQRRRRTISLPKLGRRTFLALTVCASLALLATVAGGITWALVCGGDSCPSLQGLEQFQPRQTSRVYAADGRFIAEIGSERRTLARLDQIPAHVRNAFIIVEDKRFHSHGGIDFRRIIGAGLANLRAGGIAQGFSTITMQLARNLFPERINVREKTLGRKLREAKVARMIEARYSKDRILELYLNQIYLGNGAYGVETASQRYFGKTVRELNLAEAATLAALPKAPERYNPRRYPERAVQRRNTVLELMRRAGAVRDADASLARAYPLRVARRRGGTGEIAPYFVEYVRRLLDERFGRQLDAHVLKVYTTLDLDLQGAAERALDRQLRVVESGQYGPFPHRTYESFVARGSTSTPDDGGTSPYLQGAFVALDPRTGAVRALVGGRDFDDSQFDRATQALRQAGSTFKPIVYATAIQSGRPPSYIVDDSPIEVPQLDSTKPWLPQNYDLEFQGPMTMRKGFYLSRNMIAIRVGMELGEQSVVEMARRFGVTTPVPPYPSIHIGSADVYPIEMVAAFSVFANLGWRVSPWPILRVENEKGEIVWKPEPTIEQVLSRAEAWLMVDMMKDVIRKGTAAASVGQYFHLPAGGKTGTTNDGGDVWFIGYTADVVAGVWMGLDKPQKIMANAQGGRLAAPAWTTFMREVYERKPEPPDWPRPRELIARVIDEPTGLLHGPQCPLEDAVTEWFIPGTEPTRECPRRAPAPRPP